MGDFLVKYDDLKRLSESDKAKADSLMKEYDVMPYYMKDVASYIGGNQAARMSRKDKDKVMNGSLRAKEIEVNLRNLLKSKEQKELELKKAARTEKQKNLNSLLNRKNQIESFLSHKLAGNRDNNIKRDATRKAD